MTLTLPKQPQFDDTAPVSAVKRAVIYLRVSSAGQVNTDYDPEGLSIPAQREACKRYAEKLGAVIVREYVEPGVSGGSLLKRAAFRRMIDETAELRDVDYVIVWSVSRWAREQEDHWVARGMVTRAGAKLLSVKEPIGENTSHGIMLEGVMAAVAASRRIEISEEVKRGIKRKIEVGGTSGLAPIGYLNTREPLPQGGEVRTVIIDPERAPIIVWAFETYATGLYSLADITILLEARGLRSRGNRRRGPSPLTVSRVHALLSNPYYVGFVTHKGHSYEGRHDPLISQELFDKVQAVLVSHRHSGERDRKHQHYLKGTIRCGTCGSQLVYSRNKGNGGIYEYFVCPRNQRGECLQSYQPTDLVEAAVEDHYATVSFSEAERKEIRKAITDDLGERVAITQQEIENSKGVLQQLKEEERKLLHMHYDERISGELFDEEQTRIRQRRQDAEALIARLSVNYDDVAATLDLALEILSDDLHDLYRRGDNTIRRLINQAIFVALFVCDETITQADFTEPFAQLRALHHAIHALPSSNRRANQRQRCPDNAKGPDPYRDREPFRVGSINEALVRPSGLEPPRTVKSTRPSTLRVYQFRHGRRGASIPAWGSRAGGAKPSLLASVHGRRYIANTCSLKRHPSPTVEASRHGPDQAPAGDLRLHSQVFRQVRLSAHRARHRQGGRFGVLLDGACASRQPREDRPAAPGPLEAKGDRAARSCCGHSGGQRARDGSRGRAPSARFGGCGSARAGGGEHRGVCLGARDRGWGGRGVSAAHPRRLDEGCGDSRRGLRGGAPAGDRQQRRGGGGAPGRGGDGQALLSRTGPRATAARERRHGADSQQRGQGPRPGGGVAQARLSR
jgi:site-specific DNA recombinase